MGIWALDLRRDDSFRQPRSRSPRALCRNVRDPRDRSVHLRPRRVRHTDHCAAARCTVGCERRRLKSGCHCGGDRSDSRTTSWVGGHGPPPKPAQKCRWVAIQMIAMESAITRTDEEQTAFAALLAERARTTVSRGVFAVALVLQRHRDVEAVAAFARALQAALRGRGASFPPRRVALPRSCAGGRPSACANPLRVGRVPAASDRAACWSERVVVPWCA